MRTELDSPRPISFPRFVTVEEAAQLLDVSAERISMWIGACKLPVAARSEYAGFLLRMLTVETVGRQLAEALPPEARQRHGHTSNAGREASMI